MFTTPNTRLRPALAAAAAILVLGAAAPASAASPDGIAISFVQDEDGADAVQLSFDPDRFAAPGAIERLRQEVVRAARYVCANDIRGIGAADAAECRADTIAAARQSLDAVLARRDTSMQVASAR